jgi:hypothetical protein
MAAACGGQSSVTFSGIGDRFGSWGLAEPGDAEVFMKKITKYNKKGDRSRHEIKLSGNRTMAISYTYRGWGASIYR